MPISAQLQKPCLAFVEHQYTIRQQCSTVSLADHIRAARMRWFGHVVRMEPGRIPHVALFSDPFGATRPRGHPPKRWHELVADDLKVLELPTNMHELEALFSTTPE